MQTTTFELDMTKMPGSLPQHRPQIIPASYGKHEERNAWGLFVTNPGYMALEVHIPTVPLGGSEYRLNFHGRLAQLGERDHREFFEASVEGLNATGRDGSQLFDVLRTENITSVKFEILYKDLDSVWYKSTCSIERDVEVRSSGLRVKFLGQSLVDHIRERENGNPPQAFPFAELLPQAREMRLDPKMDIPATEEFGRDLRDLCNVATAESPLSLIMMDVDHFKTINDTHGHDIGNEVLMYVGQVLKTVCRKKAIPYRWGGDEIAILLPNYTSAEAAAFAERVRVQVGRSPETLPKITTSVGVATFPIPVQDADGFFKAADTALYRAKRNGRNQVCIADPRVSVEQQTQPLTERSLSLYMRSDERVRRMDESIATHAGQPFEPFEDASLHVFEKAQQLGIQTVQELQEVVRMHGDLGQKVARCMVPITPVSAGSSLGYVLDVAAAKQGLQTLRSYFGSLKYSNTTRGFADEFVETLKLLEP
jgi:diguanylate cyclase (GGDEF)-like protein